MYSRKIGRQDRNEPAISGPHANRSSIIKSESINGNVLAAESVIMTNAYRYSFHASVKQKINVETIPGRARGKNTRNIVCKCPQPSTLAASSISFGTVLKYAISIHIAYANHVAHIWEMLFCEFSKCFGHLSRREHLHFIRNGLFYLFTLLFSTC